MSTDREVANFERLASKTKEQLAVGGQKSKEWLQSAVDAAADQLENAGELSKEEGERAKKALKRDLSSIAGDFVQAGSSLKTFLHPKRVGTGLVDLTSHLLGNLNETFKDWAQRSERALTFSTGEVTGPGTLTCNNCGTELNRAETTRIPPCPKCHETSFRKSY
jgi:hypothetical protein